MHPMPLPLVQINMQIQNKRITQRKSLPSNLRVLVNRTVRAGILRPIANVSVANSAYHTITHAHLFNCPFSGTTRVSRYQKGKTNLDFSEARNSEWQWHQLGHMQACTAFQTHNHASTPTVSFLQAGCPSCRPTNSVKALKMQLQHH